MNQMYGGQKKDYLEQAEVFFSDEEVLLILNN